MNIMDFAINMINQNPSIANNPQAKDLMEVIRSGDSTRGQQIAENLCNTYGVPKEEAISKAKGFFNI